MNAEVYVARQPILNIHQELYAYELLFRSNVENYFDLDDGDQATNDVITTSFFFIGIQQLTGGKRASINFTQNLLVNGVASFFSPDQIIVEILENVEPVDQVLMACRQLKNAGYTIALDDFIAKDLESPLLEYADIIKVDFENTSTSEQQEIPQQLPKHLTLLAEKIETPQKFHQAGEWGYSLFQGYFFSKPVIKKGHTIPGNKLSYLQMMQKVNKKDIEFEEIERIIKQDLALTYKLLRWINSAHFGLRVEVQSIKQALILLGADEIKKWISLLAMEKLAEDCPRELTTRSVIRGIMCEELAPHVNMQARNSELFLTGMFTLLDTIMGVPLEEIVGALPLSSDISDALLGKINPFRNVLEIVLTYEEGNWDIFTSKARVFEFDEAVMPDIQAYAIEQTRMMWPQK